MSTPQAPLSWVPKAAYSPALATLCGGMMTSWRMWVLRACTSCKCQMDSRCYIQMTTPCCQVSSDSLSNSPASHVSCILNLQQNADTTATLANHASLT